MEGERTHEKGELRRRYAKTMDLIKGFPEYHRFLAEKRFLLIKEFEMFLEKESEKLNSKRIKTKSLKTFCEHRELNPKTFYRHLELERKGGIAALVPKWGKRKGTGPGPVQKENQEATPDPLVPGSVGCMETGDRLEDAEFRLQHAEALDRVTALPDYKRIPAERRFLLIKEFEVFMEKESERLNSKRIKTNSLKTFCEHRELNCKTFYRHLQLERKGGIEALVPEWGGRKGASPHRDSILKILEEIVEPGKRFKWLHDKLGSICEEKGMEVPNYHTVRRICIESGLSDVLSTKTVSEPATVVSKAEKPVEKANEIPNRYRIPPPRWLRIPAKRAFNMGIYKYSLVTPFLDPDLSRKERDRLIDEVTGRMHHPSPGVSLKISRPSLLKYISIVKKDGCEGLFSQEGAYYARRYKDFVWATFKVDMKDPLQALFQLRETVRRGPSVSPDVKEISLRFLDQCQASLDDRVVRYKPMFLHRPLTDEERQRLEGYKKGTHKNQKVRAKALLMAEEHCTMPEIVIATERSQKTIHRWFGLFKERGIDFVETRPNREKYDAEIRKRKDGIIKILHTKPMDYNINKTEWILEDIARVYEREYGKKYSTTLIRRAIKQANYSWRRAKRVLTSPDPEYRTKTKRVLDTLRNLGPNGAFFFVDEGGPYAVKKYGGKSLTLKGTVKIYPQFQKSKGSVTFIGALDAVKNQVMLLFTKSKDTAAVVNLIKILYYRYHKYKNLYITWDCASWHRSKDLQTCLDALNADSKGPTIKVVPLPKQSQFLNVIEALFGGMKKAVIFNSDYTSEYQMKMAIVRHFRERNAHYRANPKRVGNKIWDKEYYDLEKLDSGLFRRM